MLTNGEGSPNPVCWQLLLNSSPQLSHYYTLIIYVNFFSPSICKSLLAVHLLWWFPIHVSTSTPVSDLKNCRSRISWSMNPGTTSACDESPDLGLKNILLFENIAICLALHFLMSCKTVSLAVLHTFYRLYEYWTKTCNSSWYRGKSNGSVLK